MISRRSLLSLAAAAPVLSACAPAPEAKESSSPSPSPSVSAKPKEKVTVGLSYIPNVQFSSFYLGITDGIFADLGLDLEVRHHGEQEDLFTALLSGAEDFVYASSDEAVIAHSPSAPLVTTATVYQRYPVCILADRSTRASSLSDLAGKKVGIPGKFGSSYYGLLAGLRFASMKEDEIDLVEVGFTQLAALQSKKVDAFVAFYNNEPVVAKANGMAVEVIDLLDPNAQTMVGPGVITVKDKFDPSVAKRINDGLLEANQRIADDPQRGLEATKRFVPLTSEEAVGRAEGVLKATIELWHNSNGEITTEINPEAFLEMCEVLSESGLWRNPVPAEQTFVQV